MVPTLHPLLLRLLLESEKLASKFAFTFNLYRYIAAQASVEEGLVAFNTCVFGHRFDDPPEKEGPWVVIGRLGHFSQSYFAVKTPYFAQYKVVGMIHVTYMTRAHELQPLLHGRPGEKVTQADVIAAFVGLREKYPGDKFFQPGRSYCFEGGGLARV